MNPRANATGLPAITLLSGLSSGWIQAQPKSDQALTLIRFELARVYALANRLDDAERLYREAYRWWPECMVLVNTLEDLAIRRGDFDEAVKLARRARELRAIYSVP